MKSLKIGGIRKRLNKSQSKNRTEYFLKALLIHEYKNYLEFCENNNKTKNLKLIKEIESVLNKEL